MKIPKLTNNNINKAVAVLLEAEFQTTGEQNLILAVISRCRMHRK